MKAETITIDEFMKKSAKRYYGSSRKVYRQCDVEKILRMRNMRSSLLELKERSHLIDYPEPRRQKARNMYNNYLRICKEIFPEIDDFKLRKEI